MDSRLLLLRFLQILISLQLLSIYVLQLPLAFEQFRSNHSKLLMNFGIFGLETKNEDQDVVQVRTHLVLASLALIITEMYKVAITVLKNAPEKTLMEDRPLMTDLLRMNASQNRRPAPPVRNQNYRAGSYKLNKLDKSADSLGSKPVEEP
jgi:hypothetical protein